MTDTKHKQGSEIKNYHRTLSCKKGKQTYMTYLSASTMNRQRYANKNKNTVSYSDKQSSLGPMSNAVIVLIMACLIGLIYLTQITKTNTFSYEIDRLQQQQSQLKEDQKDLDLTTARLRTLDSEAVSNAADKLVTTQPTATLR